jgi:APA family basic amino acid/polyamine antiporter
MAAPSQTGLVRAMGRWTLTALVINAIVGSGIYGLPTLVSRQVGRSAPWAYLLAAAGMGAIMACFAEVSSRFSEAGGPYLYARAAFGRFWGIEIGWLVYLARLTAGAGNANVFVLYLGEFWPAAGRPLNRSLVLAVLVTMLAAVNYRGVKSGARLSNFFTISKLLPLVFLIVCGSVYLMLRGPGRPVEPSASAGLNAWLQSVLLLVYTYGGFEGAIIAAGEAKEPRRDTPFALLAALAVCTVLFTSVQVVVQGTLADPGKSDRPLAAAARVLLGTPGAVLLTLGALLAVYGLLSAMTLYVPRLTYALAEREDFPPVFARVHRRFHTPHVSIVLFGVAVWALATAGSFKWNATLSAVARLFAYGAVCAAMLVLRRRQPGEARFSLPAGTIFGILGIAFALVLVSRMGKPELAVIAGTMVIALLNWLWVRSRR